MEYTIRSQLALSMGTKVDVDSRYVSSYRVEAAKETKRRADANT